VPILATDWQMLGSPAADWITAIVALVALIVAGIAARYTSQTNRAQQETLELQRKQYEDARQQVERSQAEKVSFYEADEKVSGFFVLNASESPIFAVIVVLPSGSPRGPETIAETDQLLPTGAEPKLLPCRREIEYFDAVVNSWLEFQDASGRAWRRDYLGKLSRIG
jgi:hypothetical protein